MFQLSQVCSWPDVITCSWCHNHVPVGITMFRMSQLCSWCRSHVPDVTTMFLVSFNHVPVAIIMFLLSQPCSWCHNHVPVSITCSWFHNHVPENLACSWCCKHSSLYYLLFNIPHFIICCSTFLTFLFVV